MTVNIVKELEGDYSRVGTLKKVLSILPNDGSKLSVGKLKEKVREMSMSPNTFYRYLEELNNEGLVIREVGNEGYPPKVYYGLKEPNVEVKLLLVKQGVKT